MAERTKAYFFLMSHDNPRLAGDLTTTLLSSSFLDLMEKPLSGTLLALV